MLVENGKIEHWFIYPLRYANSISMKLFDIFPDPKDITYLKNLLKQLKIELIV